MNVIKMLMMAALAIVSVSLFAQDSTKQKSKVPKQKMEVIQYSCPMHPDISGDKPGKCSKCGMSLVKTEKEHAKEYVCPMHPDVVSDKPGNCSKCGMNLKEKMIQEIVYACPMKCEGDKTYDKAGKCPICGMNLKEVKKKEEKKDDHTGHQH